MQTSTDGALLQRLLAAVDGEVELAVELRHELHAHPELAHAEQWTARAVQAQLPLACTTVAGTGQMARVGEGPGPIAIRCELDGLPVREQTGSPFSAVGDVMHACGHDVHMAALVALTRAAHAIEDALPAPLLALFQPSEEAYPSGAQLLAAGELAAVAPAAVVAAHIHPGLPWGTVGLDPGIVNASCDAIEVTVEGEPTHGAYPHEGRDPILALAQIVVALHAQVARRTDPLWPASLTVGVVEGGSAENVIPARATARGALRAHRPEDRLALADMVRQTVGGIAAAHGCRGSVELVPGEPALDNDPAIVDCARALLAGADLAPSAPWRSCGSDDFSFFGELAPIAMAFVGLSGADGFVSHPLHHPELLVPDSAVRAVAHTQTILYLAAALAQRQAGR